MAEFENLKIGDRIYKARPFSKEDYIRFGGNRRTVPIGSEGEIVFLSFSRKIVSTKLDIRPSNERWDFDISEIEKCKTNLNGI